VLGAALVIHSGTGTRSAVTRLLSAPPLVFVGLISFAAPMALGTARFPSGYLIRPHREAGLTLIAAVVVAILSWRFERPFGADTGSDREGGLLGAGVSSLVLAAYGGAVLATDGFPGRSPPG
jgi:peptidoglycan/LPS O-acetylase OafA/YrhL